MAPLPRCIGQPRVTGVDEEENKSRVEEKEPKYGANQLEVDYI